MKYIILPQKSSVAVYNFFLLSSFVHFLLFISFDLFFKRETKNYEVKQNKVYVQIAPTPRPVVETPKDAPKPVELPKIPVPKKLVQKNPVATNKAPLVQEPPPEKIEPKLTNPDLPISTLADANDVSENPVAEAIVDKAARCKTPEIPITQDAANAGITSGKVVLEVQISSSGKVIEAKLLKGTGFKIDDSVISYAKNMQCSPAEKDGKKVPVVKRLQWIIQR